MWHNGIKDVLCSVWSLYHTCKSSSSQCCYVSEKWTLNIELGILSPWRRGHMRTTGKGHLCFERYSLVRIKVVVLLALQIFESLPAFGETEFEGGISVSWSLGIFSFCHQVCLVKKRSASSYVSVWKKNLGGGVYFVFMMLRNHIFIYKFNISLLIQKCFLKNVYTCHRDSRMSNICPPPKSCISYEIICCI